MTNRTKKTSALAAVVALSLGGGAYAATQSGSKPTALTGSITENVSDAVLAKYPGATLTGVESEPGGTFEAEILKSDGTQLHVELDKTYKITGTHTGGPGGRGPGGPGGPGGHRGPDTAALAKALGVSESKLTAALDKAFTAGRAAHEAAEASAIAKALGVSADDVAKVLAANQPAGPGGPGGRGHGGPGRGPDDALVTALAKQFNVSTDKARSALEAAHQDRDGMKDDLAAALAKELGLDQAKVQSALDAQRPQHP